VVYNAYVVSIWYFFHATLDYTVALTGAVDGFRGASDGSISKQLWEGERSRWHNITLLILISETQTSTNSCYTQSQADLALFFTSNCTWSYHKHGGASG
jgi:hypothetical protein